ncbi:MAG TPA: hypothetical protein VFQ45_09215 [Longimicrobium sp.]|nr:hypothetical protein [Longimicrobium sp.]
MATAVKRAEVVAEDEEVGEQLRAYLEDLDYDVEVKREVETSVRVKVDIIVYHVSPDAARVERRSKARPQTPGKDPPRFWLDAVHTLSACAPDTPILVAVPAGEDAADKALDSGATDVIEATATPKVFRRRVELLEALSHAAAPAAGGALLSVPLPELRDEISGRIDARRVAGYLQVPLRQLCGALRLPYGRVHKTPDAAGLQRAFAPLVRVLELADTALGSREAVRMWLNRPLYELENDSPLAVVLAGEAGAVQTLLENARIGVPG